MDGRAFEAILIKCSRQGASLPNMDGAPAVPLDLPRLHLVQAVARGPAPRDPLLDEIVANHSAERPALEKLWGELQRRGALLTETDAKAARVAHGRQRYGVVSPDPAPAPADPSGPLVLVAPFMVRAVPEGFEWVHHDGRVVRFTAEELLASLTFATPASPTSAFEAQREALGPRALRQSRFDELLGELAAVSLLRPPRAGDDKEIRTTSGVAMPRIAPNHHELILAASERVAREHEQTIGADERVRVHFVNTVWTVAPAALGFLLGFAREHESGRLQQHYDLHPQLLMDARMVEQYAERGGIFLFSNYIWNHRENLALSARIKKINPFAVTVHGGPDTPGYPEDCERHLREAPHVDVAVRGEGELTFAEVLSALVGHVGRGAPDFSPLRDVSGVAFLLNDEFVRTPDRPRIADLDTIPSPILAGLFDPFIQAGPGTAIVLESNRGCPFGCTFCDWGSATRSKIRKFDLDRVYAELEWCARNEVWSCVLADANFGIFPRDVEIAEKIAALKRQHGYPGFFGTNYTKNGTRNLSKIIETLSDVGILAEGKISLQTHDTSTLVTIRRKNIKLSSYDELGREFEKRKLPMSVELMMGLPGSTVDSLLRDLQDCIDRDVRAHVYSTVLLANSPMNDPEYRAEQGIVAKPGEEIREARTFTREDWQSMVRLSRAYLLFDFFGVLRQLATYVRAETGVTEVEFYDAVVRASREQRGRWPMLAATLEITPSHMIPPAGWRPFLDDVVDFAVSSLGVPNDAALDSAATAQLALLPARERTFPARHELPHDYVAWHAAVRRERSEERVGWEQRVPRLRSLPPGVLTVTDPNGVCNDPTSGTMLSRNMQAGIWELGSNLARNFVRANASVPATAGAAE